MHVYVSIYITISIDLFRYRDIYTVSKSEEARLIDTYNVHTCVVVWL